MSRAKKKEIVDTSHENLSNLNYEYTQVTHCPMTNESCRCDCVSFIGAFVVTNYVHDESKVYNPRCGNKLINGSNV